jgi:DNA-binding MarR family transcriptional regulator
MTNDPKKQDLGLLDGLVQLSFTVQEALERVAESHGLSLVQVRLLGILRDREPAMLELATFLNLDKSSVTGLVGRAEKRGLVRRISTQKDRRAVNVIITPRGRELAQKIERQVEREVEALVRDWSDADRKKMSALASRIVTTSRAASEEP